jgi:hypothetical protein
MPGFLDERAPKVDAEYGRYMDGDILGKFLFKNFILNRAKVPTSDLHIPVGRFGDVGTSWTCGADAQVRIDGKWKEIEIKCARVNIANKTRGGSTENWAFNKILETTSGESKQFDLACFIAVRTLGLEDPNYWPYLATLNKEYSRYDIPFKCDALPHEVEFLSLCSFIIVPHSRLVSNYFRVMLSTLSTGEYSNYHAWGHELRRCRLIWNSAVKGGKGVTRSQSDRDFHENDNDDQQ